MGSRLVIGLQASRYRGVKQFHCYCHFATLTLLFN